MFSHFSNAVRYSIIRDYSYALKLGPKFVQTDLLARLKSRSNRDFQLS